jgi:hypothetical protein
VAVITCNKSEKPLKAEKKSGAGKRIRGISAREVGYRYSKLD